MTVRVGVTRAASHLPPGRMGAAELAARIGVPEKRVREEYGIETKAVSEPGVTALDHALAAGRKLLDGLEAGEIEEIDLLVYTSSSPPDHLFWTGGYKLHAELGLTHAKVQELNVGCIGGLHALELARNALIADPRVRRAMVVAAEGFHFDPEYANYGHAANEPMYILADGAAAVLLDSDRAAPLPNHLGPFSVRVEASLYPDHPVPAGGARRPMTAEAAAAGEQWLRMAEKDPRELRKFGLLYLQQYIAVIQEALSAAGVEQADWLISNQLKLPLMKILVGRLGLPFDHAIYTMTGYGHVGTADVLLGIEAALPRMQPGETAALVASGVGFAWGASTLRAV